MYQSAKLAQAPMFYRPTVNWTAEAGSPHQRHRPDHEGAPALPARCGAATTWTILQPMARITSDCGATRSLGIKMARITSGCAPVRHLAVPVGADRVGGGLWQPWAAGECLLFTWHIWTVVRHDCPDRLELWLLYQSVAMCMTNLGRLVRDTNRGGGLASGPDRTPRQTLCSLMPCFGPGWSNHSQ